MEPPVEPPVGPPDPVDPVALPTLNVDETVGPQDDPQDTVSDRVSSADFSGAFTNVAGVVAYGLSVSDANGVPLADDIGMASGLYAVDTQSLDKGAEILLYNTANGIEGRIPDPINGNEDWVYFTIATDDAGIVTLEQSFLAGDYPLTIWHPNATNPDDVVSLNGDGSYEINLTQTAGGASVSVDLAAGQGDAGAPVYVFNFADDAPIAQDDFAGEGNALVVSGRSATFNVIADNGLGQDDPGVDAADLILDSGIAVTSGPGKGSVSYEGNGQFTYTAADGQFGEDTFEYTITDADGDASTATVYLTIEGPDPVDLPTLNVDETVGPQDDPQDTVSDRVSSADFSGAFTNVAGVVAYGLSVSDANGVPLADDIGMASGLYAVDTQSLDKGAEILLYNTANGIEGRIPDPINGNEDWVYFTIATDDAGIVTLEQSFLAGDYPLTIWHPNATNPDDVVSLNGDGSYEINLTQTAGGASVSVDLAAGQGDAGAPVYVFNFADDAPIAQDDFAGEGNALVVSGRSATFNVIADNGLGQDDPGVDAADLILDSGIAVTSGPGKGSVSYEGNGQFTYTAADGQFGEDTFEYTITDADGDASTATVYLTIEEVFVPQAFPLNSPEGDAGTLVAIEGAADVFAWSLGDETTDGDLIVGFNPDEDSIDIADLLVGLDTADLTQFLEVGLADDGASTVIKVSASGDFASADQVITVQDVDLFADVDFGDLSAVNSALQSLVDAGKLIAD